MSYMKDLPGDAYETCLKIQDARIYLGYSDGGRTHFKAWFSCTA